MYEVRYRDPKRFQFSDQEVKDYVSTYMKQMSNRPSSQGTQFSKERRKRAEKDFYDCQKGSVKMKELMYYMDEDFIETQIDYTLEDFNMF